MKKALLILISLFSGTILMAQTVAVNTPTTTVTGTSNTDTLLLAAIWVVIVVAILVLIVAIYALSAIRTVLLAEKSIKGKESDSMQDIVSSVSLWGKLSKTLTNATPVEQESTVMLDHNYDGIRELDNHLPPWWKGLFFFTIGWAAIYLLAFHVIKIFPLSGDEFTRQMTRAEEQLTARKSKMAESIDETTVVFSNDPSILNNGKAIFEKNCIPCHAADGGGGVGPNFTDKYWIHGGRINDIFKTIKYGVPEKGMITWGTQLKPSDMRDVSCYIQTLVGTTPAKPKEPQGTLYEPEKIPAATPDSSKQVIPVSSTGGTK